MIASFRAFVSSITPLTGFRWVFNGWNSMIYPPGDVLIQVAYAALNYKDALVSEVTLDDIPRVTQAMLGGQTRGRILVRPGEP